MISKTKRNVLAILAWHRFLCLLLLCNLVSAAAGAQSGPTIALGDGKSEQTNAVSDLLYFIPLISPEPVSASASADSQQSARIMSASRHVNGSKFDASCEIEFFGAGSYRSVIDLEPQTRRNESRLKSGAVLEHVLKSIDLNGPGKLEMEIEGVISNEVRIVTEVRLKFNAVGKESPVTIELCDIRYADGHAAPTNYVVARVNSLTFRRADGRPKMEVGLASVKAKTAGDSFWQNFKGRVKGVAANIFVPPLPVERIGNSAMLDFGLALATGEPTFTFP